MALCRAWCWFVEFTIKTFSDQVNIEDLSSDTRAWSSNNIALTGFRDFCLAMQAVENDGSVYTSTIARGVRMHTPLRLKTRRIFLGFVRGDQALAKHGLTCDWPIFACMWRQREKNNSLVSLLQFAQKRRVHPECAAHTEAKPHSTDDLLRRHVVSSRSVTTGEKIITLLCCIKYGTFTRCNSECTGRDARIRRQLPLVLTKRGKATTTKVQQLKKNTPVC